MDTRINEKLTYFLYARKSSESEDRQVQSIDDQINHFRKISRDANINIVEVFTESRSAKKPNNRPIFSEMLKRIERGEANGIVCWKLDRLARNPVDAGSITWLLQTGVIKHIKTFEGGFYPTDNVLLMSVEFGIANQYIIDLRKNCRRGMLSKVEHGWRPGTTPIGYMNDKEEKQILTDNERFPLVRQMWDMMLSGNYTPQQIRKIANEQWGFRTPKHKRMGGCEVSNSTIYKIFSNIFYTGMFEWSGTLYQGKHTPLVSLEEFDRVQIILGRKTSPRAQKHDFAFTGMFRCGHCNSMVTATEKNKLIKTRQQWKSFQYYHCTRKLKHEVKCTNAPIRPSDLEKLLILELERYTIAPDFLGWAIEILHAEGDNLSAETNRIKATREKTLLEVQGELENLTRMRYREMIDDAEFMTEKAQLSEKIVKLKSQLNDGTDYDKRYIELTESAFRFAAFAQQNFINGAKKDKREVINALGSNYRLKDKAIIFEASVWLIPIIKAYPSLYAEFKRLELENTHIKQAPNAALSQFILSLSGCIEDVRTAIHQSNNPTMQLPKLNRVENDV